MSDSKRIINIGVIGAGGIAKNHLFALSLVENNARKIWGKGIKPQLYALADIDNDRLNTMATHFPPQVKYAGVNAGEQLIADPMVHVVYVLVPTKYHLDFVVKAAQAGKHVFCEKPLAFNPEDVQKMIIARDRYKVIMQAGLVMRSAPQITYMKKIFKENQKEWGRVTNISFRDTQEKPYKGAEEVHNSTWRSDKSLAHAGILFEHTIHDIDAMVSIFGEVEDVYAKVNYYGGKEGIEDSVAAILTLKNGINLSVTSVWNDIDYSARRFEIFSERAYLMVTVDERDGKAVSMKIKCGKNPEQELDNNIMDSYFRESIGMSHIKGEVAGPYYYEDVRFLDSIVKGIPSPVPLEAGKYVQTIIEACYESSRTNKSVKIKP
jgi:predicted dehydrogenase